MLDGAFLVFEFLLRPQSKEGGEGGQKSESVRDRSFDLHCPRPSVENQTVILSEGDEKSCHPGLEKSDPRDGGDRNGALS